MCDKVDDNGVMKSGAMEMHRLVRCAVRSRRRLACATVLHPIVDACSASVLVVGGMSWGRILAYNAIAFAVQFPLGVMLDMRPAWTRDAFGVGLALTLAGVACAAIAVAGSFSLPISWLALALACLGNALFHLSAGKTILDEQCGKGGPIGMFISTGALGLLAGMKLAKVHGSACFAGFGAALAVVGVMGWWCGIGKLSAPRMRLQNVESFAFLTLVGLLALVAWRSWAGIVAVRMTSAVGLAFVCAGAAVTWAGKAAGGFIGERFGRRWVTAFSVAGSIMLCACSCPEHTVLWLLLLFVAQLATGPVLSLMYDKTGRAGGTAFGLNCLGLFTGSL